MSMADRLGVLSWSIPFGRLFLTQIRVSPLCVLVAAILCLRLGWEVGLVFSGFLFIALLAHELGHVLAARLTGGMADEILIWPLGGLAAVQPGPTAGAAWKTVIAGPLVNLLLGLLFFPGFYAPELLWGVLNPLEIPVAQLTGADWGRQCLLLAFAANWLLLLVNLLPIFPLDGGQLLSLYLSTRWPVETVYRTTANIGGLASLVLLTGGLALDLSWVVAIGAVILVLNLLLALQLQSTSSYDDSFMGYDFSQGYTSLERSGDPSDRAPRQSWLETWKARRREKQQSREANRRLDLERQLDQLLEKVHLTGMNSLTDAEKRLLRKASEELRHRSRPQDS